MDADARIAGESGETARSLTSYIIALESFVICSNLNALFHDL